MNEIVHLHLDFQHMPKKYYGKLAEIMLRPDVTVTTDTVYKADAGLIRNAIAVLNRQHWFNKYVSKASIDFIDEDINIIGKMDRFNKMVIHMGKLNKKERLRQLVSF